MLETGSWQGKQAVAQSVFYTFMPSDKIHVFMSAVGVLQAADVISSDAETSKWTFPEREISHIIVKCFVEIPEVQSVCAQLRDDEIIVWTLLESYDRDAREKVYEKELVVCESLHLYDFDFRVTSIDLVSSQDLVAGGFREIYKRT